MSIKIERVSLKNLGPLPEFDQSLKLVNLFYGHNETGKTYLVEFLYRSLFKHLKLSLRDNIASGNVIVSGLEKGLIDFSPSGKKKLEDFWGESLPGLPADFSRLLVVKGADLDMADEEQGIDDKILKEFLSGEGLLEEIGGNISKTVADSTYENGVIQGPSRGEISKNRDKKAALEKIDDLIGEVEEQYSGGTRAKMAAKIKALEQEKETQKQAKHHLAFILSGEISDLEAELKNLPQEQISELDRKIYEHKQNQNRLTDKREVLKENRQKSIHFRWLEKAAEQYGRLVLLEKARKSQSGLAWLVLTAVLLIAAAVLTFLEQTYFGVGAIILSIVSGTLYLYMLNRMPVSDVQKEEMKKIEEGYRERFGGDEKVGEATLSARKEELRGFHSKTEVLEGDIESIERELNDLEVDINHRMEKLPQGKGKKEDWAKAVIQFQKEHDRLEKDFHEKSNELSSLNLPKEAYRETPVKATFEPDHYRSLTEKLQEAIEALGDAENELQQLKQAICGLTGENIDIQWDQLIENLYQNRGDTVEEYKEITAGIIAGITVNQALDELREHETARIDDGLRSDEVSRALEATTDGKYKQVVKEGGELIVSGTFGSYPLKTLSTGAREQVLLALRLGFAGRLLEGKTLFLILDDAFQHSDWERREKLVEKVFSLAGEGWQVLYFTMDDHIRKLFEVAGKKLGKVGYQTIEVQGV